MCSISPPIPYAAALLPLTYILSYLSSFLENIYATMNKTYGFLSYSNNRQCFKLMYLHEERDK